MISIMFAKTKYYELFKRGGFTLIEMLVVISIVGVLAGLTLTGMTSVRKNARDTQRRSDINQYRSVLEAYAANNAGKYPSYISFVTDDGELCSSLAVYLGGSGNCPHDPGETTTYRYISDGSGGGAADANNYALETTIETGGYWYVCSIGKTVSSAVKLTDPLGDDDGCGTPAAAPTSVPG